jgi:ribonuclease P protein component
MQLSILEG